jgi:hypothetical protein
MALRSPGRLITATAPTVTSTSTGKGIFTGTEIAQYKQAGNWASLPGAPTSVIATAGNTQASVSFTAPASNGGFAIISYTVTSSPGNFTATGSSSPLTVTGLTNGIGYTFTVTATTSLGTGPASSASSSVTPYVPVAPSTVEYLVVAGGGGGGFFLGGGGGAGGYRTGTSYAVSTGTPITVTIGGGGTGSSTGAAGTNGSNCAFGTITSTGGGGGATHNSAAASTGGSGGGGCDVSFPTGAASSPVTSPVQGYKGGDGSNNSDYTDSGGGGGGAGGPGVSSNTTNIDGDGGLAVQWSDGIYYAGGGGAGTGYQRTSGKGGLGGGTAITAQKGGAGDGGYGTGTGVAGTSYTGGGGGGGGNGGSGNAGANGGNGGSGVVIIRYPAVNTAAASTTGSPTVTTPGDGYRYYKWTASSGSITF